MYKLYYWLFLAKINMANCIPERTLSGFHKGKNHFQINKTGQLPNVVNECSGIIFNSDKQRFFTHNDGGNLPQIFEINQKGQLLNTITIPNSTNIDWEDITADQKGNLYIGDFGNNANTRQNLNIIKYTPAGKVSKINFQLADQQEFPPKKRDRNFDFEAFFWANDSLYLFSKNRGQKNTKLYKLPDVEGNYKLKPAQTIFLNANITGAAVNPSQTLFALLSYGKIFMFGIKSGNIGFQKPLFCIKAPLKQAEAITFLTENQVMITNEQGEMYNLSLKEKKQY
jgi:uncharacterized protein YjiK